MLCNATTLVRRRNVALPIINLKYTTILLSLQGFNKFHGHDSMLTQSNWPCISKNMWWTIHKHFLKPWNCVNKTMLDAHLKGRFFWKSGENKIFSFHFPQPISLKMHKVHSCQALHNDPQCIASSPKMQQVSHYLHILHLDFIKPLVPIDTIDLVSMYTCMAPAPLPVGTRLRSLQTWEWDWWNMLGIEDASGLRMCKVYNVYI